MEPVEWELVAEEVQIHMVKIAVVQCLVVWEADQEVSRTRDKISPCKITHK